MDCKFVLSAVLVLVVYSVNAQNQSNGDRCTLSDQSGVGICTPLKECATAIVAIQNGLYPEPCGYIGNTPLVCCSSGSPQLQETVSQQKCREYSTFVPEYQIFAIVGGTQTAPTEFPHMAALGYTNGNEILWNCGGSLVSENYVLTAGHCLNHISFGPITHARLGSTALPSSRVSVSAAPQDIPISMLIPHPQYRSPSTYNDIALLRLSRPAQFSNFVKPACLYTSPTIPSTAELTATGWGLTDTGGDRSNELQKVDLDLYTEQECNTTYENMEGTRKLRVGIKPDEQFCAGGRNSNRDTCMGDSGGPLQTYNRVERIWNIVGITSFGKTCGDSIPGVYTRVSHYVPWLESVIWPTN